MLISINTILLWVALSISSHSAAHPDIVPREAQSCKSLINPVRNGDFETGKLAPWKFSAEKFSGAKTSGSIAKGYKSKYSGQLYGANNNAIGMLGQNISLCKGSEYEFSWVQYLDQAVLHGSSDHCMTMYAQVTDADGGTLSFFSFGMQAKYYTQGGSPGTRYPARQWHSFNFTYTVRQSGTATFFFQLLVASDGCSGTWRYDNVVAKLLS